MNTWPKDEKRQPLNDAQLRALYADSPQAWLVSLPSFIDIVRLVEAQHDIQGTDGMTV